MKIKNYYNNNELEKYNESMSIISKTINQYSRDFTPAAKELAERLKEVFVVIEKDYEENYKQSFQIVAQRLEEVFKVIPDGDIIKYYQNSIKDIEFDSIITKSTKTNKDDEIEVAFTDSQLNNIKNLNIDINDYCKETKSTKNKKVFSKEFAIEFIAVLIALISLFQQIIAEKKSEDDSKQIQQSVIELEKINENTEEIVELLREHLSHASADEATR